jgi:hypothetical protein
MGDRGGGKSASWRRPRRLVTAATAVLCLGFAAEPAPAAKEPEKARPTAPAVLAPQPHVETVSFADPRHAPVKVVRGVAGPLARPTPQSRVEVLSFGRGGGRQVTVVRGVAPAASGSSSIPKTQIEKVAFADPSKPSVTVVRGPPLGSAAVVNRSIELFGPAKGGELDRISFAVDGIESRHGADPRMWRPEPDGPQGPMQVSLKAAIDVGGGNRFDLLENRLLGRAYLAQMYRRYGNWADALAAYNWGPGNLDQWIAGGRRAEVLPLETTRYVERALRNALLSSARW